MELGLRCDEWRNAKESVNISVVEGEDYGAETKAGIISAHATMALHTQPLQTGLPRGALEHRTKPGSPTHPMQILCQSLLIRLQYPAASGKPTRDLELRVIIAPHYGLLYC